MIFIRTPIYQLILQQLEAQIAHEIKAARQPPPKGFESPRYDAGQRCTAVWQRSVRAFRLANKKPPASLRRTVGLLIGGAP